MIRHSSLPDTAPPNFWERMSKPDGDDGCWLWQGSKVAGGYGNLTYQQKQYRCHRLALHLHSPAPSLECYACHTCDVPSCCNPKHLYWGSPATNVVDRDGRGRRNGPRGVSHHKAKLDPDKVREIRRLAGSVKQRDLAKMFGVRQGVIWNVIHRKFWKEVEE